MNTKLATFNAWFFRVLGLVWATVAGAQSLQLTTLVNFNNTNGAYPQTGLTLGADGSLYGATYSGGTNQSGTVFKVKVDGNFASFFSFSAGAYTAGFTAFTNANGAVPYGQLALGTDGSFYGTSSSGTSNGHGSVFRITTSGLLSSLVSFNTTNGATPNAGVVAGNDGFFYGTTLNGGTSGRGTVFKVTTNGILMVLANFNGTNGAAPFAALTPGRDGLFYGTTQLGGTNNNGTVFKITPNGIFASIFSFDALVGNGSGANTNVYGASLLGGLTQGNDGNFYGTARLGGKYGYGTAFKVTTNGMLTKLADFNNTNGASPEASLLLAGDGGFYGTTYGGGTNGAGTVFKLATNGIITTLHSFSPTAWSGSGYTNANGAYLESPLTFGADGDLYGTTLNGGSGGFGTVFTLALPRLNLRPLAGRVVLSWTNAAFSLQSAPEAIGSYDTIAGAVSPYTNTLGGSRKFFRLIGN